MKISKQEDTFKNIILPRSVIVMLYTIFYLYLIYKKVQKYVLSNVFVLFCFSKISVFKKSPSVAAE